ncbi:retrovirus-related pol polyprotein from transposon TNT 1-94 [Tanacetum coccineum]
MDSTSKNKTTIPLDYSWISKMEKLEDENVSLDFKCLRYSKKEPASDVAVYVRKNKQTDNTSANVIQNKENVIDVDVANASITKNLLCVSCMKNCSSRRSVGSLTAGLFRNSHIRAMAIILHANHYLSSAYLCTEGSCTSTFLMLDNFELHGQIRSGFSFQYMYVTKSQGHDLSSSKVGYVILPICILTPFLTWLLSATPFCLMSKANFNKPCTMNTKNIKEAMADHKGKSIIALKWLWKNKCDAENIVVQNKTRLVAKGYKQEEGIDFEESFAPVAYVLRLFRISTTAGIIDPTIVSLANIPTVHPINKRLDADLQGTPTDQTTYRRMIGGLMYLIANRPDIAFATFVCAHYQARPTVKHLKEHAVAQVIWMRTTTLELTEQIQSDFDVLEQNTNFAIYLLRALPKERFEYLVHRIVIIMAQQQHAADVHPDELCPPNKRYDLMDANKKVDLEHFWHTLKEDGSKYQLRFMMDKKELTLTLDDFRQIFHLPQATANNHNSFVPPPSFSDMVPFYKQIMQMLYCFVNNIHVDYAELLWEGLYYLLHHPTSSIPYLRFTKIIVSNYMTIFSEISRRPRDMYHNFQDDDIMKNIFNSRRHKNKVRMQILAWMITDEKQQTEHYRMYAEVFGIDVPLTQSQPT